MKKLSETQMEWLEELRSDDDPNWVITTCLYDRTRAGLVRAGVIHEVDGVWKLTQEALDWRRE